MSARITPPTPWRGTRAQTVQRLLERLLDDPVEQFPLRRRDLGDPTVALIDAWATMTDVVAFYDERIRLEGYLDSAVQPESVLALAALTGTTPRAALAASVHLAYTLYPDDADTPSVLVAGMLAQATPGPGEQAQTFQTTADLVARPSWNTLDLLGSPSIVDLDDTLAAGADTTTTLDVATPITPLRANDVLLLRIPQEHDRVLQVRTIKADPVTRMTQLDVCNLNPPPPSGVDAAAGLDGATHASNVDGAAPAPDAQGATRAAPATAAAPETSSPAVAEADADTAVDNSLVGTLARLQGKIPASARRVLATHQLPSQIFTPTSDVTPRIMAALHPELRASLYSAVATTSMGGGGAPQLSVLQTSAAPFGAQAPPQPVFSSAGRQIGTRDWAPGGTQTITVTLDWRHPVTLAARAGHASGAVDAVIHAAESAVSGGVAGLEERIVREALPVVEQAAEHVEHEAQAAVSSLGRHLDGLISAFLHRHEPSNAHSATDDDPPPAGESPAGESPAGESPAGATPPPPTDDDTGVARSAAAAQPSSSTADSPADSTADSAAQTRRSVPTHVTVRVNTDGFTPKTLPMSLSGTAGTADLGELGRLTSTAEQHGAVEITYAPGPSLPAGLGFTLTATSVRHAGTIEFAIDGESASWTPALGASFYATLGARELTVDWAIASDQLTATLRSPGQLSDATVLHLDARYDQIIAGSAVVITSAGAAASTISYPVVTTVLRAEPVSISRYGLTARVTRLSLADRWLPLDATMNDLRAVSVYAQPVKLSLSDRADLGGHQLELATLHAGLDVGRTLIVAGLRTDLPGSAVTQAGEVAVVASVDITADPGGSAHTTLTLSADLAHTYRRDSVQIYGNVVDAQQSATMTVPLGSGDPTIANQQFTLGAGPTLSDPTTSGVVSSLSIHVDGLRYHEVTRIDQDTAPASYLTATDATGKTVITFAAPLPRGTNNIVANYRYGYGSQGNVRPGQVSQLLTKPLAVRSVTNPLAGSGGADPESPDQLRSRVGVGLASLGRPVSIPDFADAALMWPGVGKARSARSAGPELSAHPDPDTNSTTDVNFPANATARVSLWVAGVTSAPLLPDSDLVRALQIALADPEGVLTLHVSPVEPLTIVVRARVACSSDWTWEAISANVTAALTAAYGYDQRDIGADILLAPLLAAMHSVPGVLGAQILGLTYISANTTPDQLAHLGTALAADVPERTLINGGPNAQVAFVDPGVPSSILLEEWT